MSVFLGVPNTGNLRTELVVWIMSSGIKHMSFEQQKPHDYCRNMIVETFLETDCEWLLMIDSDVVPQTNILEMIKHDRMVCAPMVRVFNGKQITPVAFRKNPPGEIGYRHHYEDDNPENAPVCVDAVGTGCILINRGVFEILPKPYFKFVYDDDGRRVLGEDLYFSELVNSVEQGRIWYDPRHRCSHYTTLCL